MALNFAANNVLLQLIERLENAERLVKTLKTEILEMKQQILKIHEDGHYETSQEIGREKKRKIASDVCDNNDDCTKGFIRENNYVIAYTDGACENNGRPNARAGIGVWFGPNHPLNISKPVVGRPTNNTAEIQACVAALSTAHKHGIDKLLIKTDSQFTINCITNWIHKWKKNGWKLSTGGDVKNKEDLVKLDHYRNIFQDVKWEYVAGHKGTVGNEEADRLAREGSLRYKKDT